MALLAIAPSIHAGIPQLVDVPDYLPADVKQDLKRKRDELEKRIDELRQQVQGFNAKYGDHTFSKDDPQAKAGLEERAKLDKAGQDYSRDATAFADRVAKVTDSMVVDARNVPSGLPKFVEDGIPPTPAGDRVRKGFEAITQRDWKVAVAWFQDALNHEPDNPELKRLADFSQYSLKRHLEMHDLPFENNSVRQVQRATLQGKDQMNPEIKADMDDFFKVLVEPKLKAMGKRDNETLLINTELRQPKKVEDPSWSKFTKWLNDTFSPKKEKEPRAVGAVRD